MLRFVYPDLHTLPLGKVAQIVSARYALITDGKSSGNLSLQLTTKRQANLHSQNILNITSGAFFVNLRGRFACFLLDTPSRIPPVPRTGPWPLKNSASRGLPLVLVDRRLRGEACLREDCGACLEQYCTKNYTECLS